MTESSRPDDSAPEQTFANGKKPFGGKKSKAGGIAIMLLAAVYSVAAPQLNSRFGWDLPQLRGGDDHAGVAQEKQTSPSQVRDDGMKATTRTASSKFSPSKSASPRDVSESKSASRGPLADRMRPTSKGSAPSNSQPSSKSVPSATGKTDSDLHFGILREVSRDRYISPEGLMYTPGSAEGHRLEHLRRHTVDAPNRAGSHGVFDGEMEGALKTIDRAYQRAKKGQRTTKKSEDGRIIYTVDMGGRVGFVGGSTGKQKRNPMARRVRLVLEGNRVITAYPM